MVNMVCFKANADEQKAAQKQFKDVLENGLEVPGKFQLANDVPALAQKLSESIARNLTYRVDKSENVPAANADRVAADADRKGLPVSRKSATDPRANTSDAWHPGLDAGHFLADVDAIPLSGRVDAEGRRPAAAQAGRGDGRGRPVREGPLRRRADLPGPAPRRAERLAPGRPPGQAGGRPDAEHGGHAGEDLRPRGDGIRADRAEGSLDGAGAGPGRRGHRRPAMGRPRGVPGRRVGARRARLAGGRGREPDPGPPPRLVGQGQQGPGRGPARARPRRFRRPAPDPRPGARRRAATTGS